MTSGCSSYTFNSFLVASYCLPLASCQTSRCLFQFFLSCIDGKGEPSRDASRNFQFFLSCIVVGGVAGFRLPRRTFNSFLVASSKRVIYEAYLGDFQFFLSCIFSLSDRGLQHWGYSFNSFLVASPPPPARTTRAAANFQFFLSCIPTEVSHARDLIMRIFQFFLSCIYISLSCSTLLFAFLSILS